MKLEKATGLITERLKRRYDDACAATHGMDLIGERWTLPVMRELMLGPRRFTDLRAGLPGISAPVLSQRLGELEVKGLVHRHRLPPPAASYVYELTDWGYEAGPIFQVLGRWAVRSAGHDRTAPFSPTSLMLSLRTMAGVPADVTARVRLRMAGEEYFWAAKGGQVAIGRGAGDGVPDLTISGDPRLIAAWIYGGADRVAFEAAGDLELQGDRALADRLPGFFPLPDPAPRPSANEDEA